MSRHIVFLHTSRVHVGTFERLVGEAAPGLRVEHIVDESLLLEAQRAGPADPVLVERVQHAMQTAGSSGAAAVVCTCSTIGGAAEHTPTGGRYLAARIDRAMADRAVQLGPKILVVAALESTLGPTSLLIRESAASAQSGVELECLVVDGAWSHFAAGRPDAFIDAIVHAIRAYAGTAAVVVLAQASMAPAAALLRNWDREVLSSPQLGVQAILRQLAGTRVLDAMDSDPFPDRDGAQ